MPEPLITEPVAFFLTIMAVILVTPILSERARLPGITGLILGGILVGPHGFGLLATGRTIELLSTVGLIYLMFSAGLEIDLHQFMRVRNKSLAFGAATFTFPLLSGIALGLLVDLGWPGAFLLGAVFASHTLVAFPIISRLGLTRNEAVSVTIGATVFTDVGALLVLAVVAGAGESGFSVENLVELLIQLLGYVVLVLFGIPRVGKEFFSRFTGRAIEFQFVLVVLFIAAFLAEVIGLHAIVGAFLAGLAVNRTLPGRSAVTHQVLFVGESFFIPIFLMYIGMITDPLAIVVNLETLLMGLALTVLVYLTKYLAAWLIARIFAYSKDERLTMWGLSQAQAAATLATILVGQEIGLFPESIFNGAILMVLLTSISSPWLVQRFGSRLQNGAVEEDDRSIFDRILIPVANPETQGHLTTLATILANTTKGVIMPLVVIPEVRGRAPDLSKQERLPESTTRDQTEVEVLPIRRIDTSVAKGILRAAAENQATLITMGWRGRPTFAQTLTRRSRIFGDVLDSVVWDADIPVAVSRLTMGINAMQRVFLVMRANSIGPNLLGAMVEMALSVAKAINVPLLILADTDYISGIRESLEAGKDEYPVEIVGLSTNAVRDVKDRADEHDLVLITSTGSKGRFQSSIGRTPEEIVAATECSVVVLRFPDKAANLVE